MKPLCSFYGGKQRIATKITPYLEAIPHTVRSIPFAGGLGVFYAWERPYVSNTHHYREAINDISGLLINLYRWARENREEFHEMIMLTPYSQAEYREAVAICKNPEGYSDKRQAWAYYVNIQMSFGNKLDAGWGTTVKSRNQAATWHTKRLRIPACLERLQDVQIGCEDALRFIERWDSPQTLHYLDPPYPGANQGHYDGYTIQDWQNLCDLLDSIEGSYVLSNYPQVVEPQSTQQRVEISAVSSASGQGQCRSNVSNKVTTRARAATSEELGDRARTEVLWICDRSANIRADLTPALNQAKYRQTSLLGAA